MDKAMSKYIKHVKKKHGRKAALELKWFLKFADLINISELFANEENWEKMKKEINKKYKQNFKISLLRGIDHGKY